MEKPNVPLISRISEYLRARAWLRDYTINRNSSGGTQIGPLDTGGNTGQEIYCSFLNGSITPLDQLMP